MSRIIHTVTRDDVGKAFGRLCGKLWGWGFVLPIDIGKRIITNGRGVVQMENCEQRDRRLACQTN